MKKFVVFGGQYRWHYYGESDSLRGAMMIATKNKEYWDNWQGWNVPRIFRVEDCMMVDGELLPKGLAVPVAEQVYGKWRRREMEG